MLTALLNLCTSGLHPSRCLTGHDFLLKLTPVLFKIPHVRVNQYLYDQSLSLANSETVFVCLYFFLPMTLKLLRGKYQISLVLGLLSLD